jgi:glycosyltransferase involved in cell wall biosynthesis
LRVAIVHDWLVTYAGSERVLEQLIALFPGADLFSLFDFLPDRERSFLAGKAVTTSFLQRLPFARRKYKAYLPLMPLAVEQFDLSAYDLVISSSHCVAKGVLTGPDQLHVSYVHTPMRYAWDAQHEYLRGLGGVRGSLARCMLHKLRAWDARSANGVDSLVANSRFIAARIEKAYGRTARVIYPPVDTHAVTPSADRDDFYLTVSRLVPYKNVDVLLNAFARLPDKQLVVIGDGPESRRLRAIAPANVRLLGHQPRDVVSSYLARAGAFIYAAREDFGIVLAEAQSAGCPVIAFGRGGAAEIVRGLESERPTGILFDEQTPESLVQAIAAFDKRRHRIRAADCRLIALRFGVERFRREFFGHVLAEWENFAIAQSRRCAPPSLRVA